MKHLLSVKVTDQQEIRYDVTRQDNRRKEVTNMHNFLDTNIFYSIFNQY